MYDIDKMNEKELIEEIARLEALLKILDGYERVYKDVVTYYSFIIKTPGS